MCNVSNTTGPINFGETSWEAGDFGSPAERQALVQDIKNKANSVPLIRVLRYYGIHLHGGNASLICPFKSHKGGKEKSPSFYYYEETNSFYCFGCKIGGKHAHACEFVSVMEEVSRYKAAEKIITLFSDDVNSDILENYQIQDLNEQLQIMMDFSNIVREFRHLHLDKESQDFIEIRCAVYDELSSRHSMDNEVLRSVVDHLKEQIKIYSAQILSKV